MVSRPVVLGSLVGALALGVVLVRDRGPKAPATPVRAVAIESGGELWPREGFVEMVAPIRPPSTEGLEARIVVYLRLPAGASIEVRPHPDGRLLLAYPSGTAADRVEYLGRGDIDAPLDASWIVADVRGMVLDDELHVYRPRRASPGSPLLGVSWPRGDDAAQREATRALGALVEDGFVAGPANAAARPASAAHLRGLNDCVGCHVAGRAPRASISAAGIVNRGADASGFFHVSTVLSDRAPLETYRPRNANAEDRFVHYFCGVAQVHPSRGGNVRCPDGAIPEAELDLEAALRAGDRHAARVCASRRYLGARLSTEGQKLFAPALRVCDAGPP